MVSICYARRDLRRGAVGLVADVTNRKRAVRHCVTFARVSNGPWMCDRVTKIELLVAFNVTLNYVACFNETCVIFWRAALLRM